MFLALFASTSWIQVVQADALAAEPAQHARALRLVRGAARLDHRRAASAIASSVPSDDVFSWQRVYTDAPMWGHVTGLDQPGARRRRPGIEQAMNQALSGTAGSQFLDRIERIITGQPPRGSNVVLTLDAAVPARRVRRARRPAGRRDRDRAGDRPRARDGVEPDLRHEPARRARQRRRCNATTTGSSPTRAIRCSTARSAATSTRPARRSSSSSRRRRSHRATTRPSRPCRTRRRYQLPQSSSVVFNASGGTCGPGDEVTIADALRLSCNIPFAELAVELGDTAIREEAEKYGFNRAFELPLVSTPSSYPRALDEPQTALTGFGQGAGDGDAAADGDGVGRHRERRNRHEPAHGRPRDRPGPLGPADVRGHRVRACAREETARTPWCDDGRMSSRRRGVGCKNRRGRRGR